MAEPVVTVQIAFDSGPFNASPVWTDVTADVREIQAHRGRNMELSTVETGTITITLDNTSGHYTPRYSKPDNTYPTIRPRRPVQVTAVWNGTTYNVCKGVIERWPTPFAGGDLTVAVTASDGFRVLSDMTFNNSDTGQLEKTKPTHYWQMQDTSLPIIDGVGGTNLGVWWADISNNTQTPTVPNASRPNVTLGANSILPSGALKSIDLGSWYDVSGKAGGNCFKAAYPKTPVWGGANGQDITVSAQCMFSIADHPSQSGGNLTIFAGFVDLNVSPNGSVNFGPMFSTPAGVFKSNTMYRISASCKDNLNGTFDYTITVNGAVYQSLGSTYAPFVYTDAIYVGGIASGDPQFASGYASGGRYSHVAIWNRALTVTEHLSLWGDTVCAPGMKADARMSKLLDYAGWDSAARNIQSGLDALNRESWTDNTSALSLLQKWAQDDGGLAFMDGGGKFCYQNRWARVNPVPVYTFDCESDTGIEKGIEFIMDETDLRNAIDLTVNYGIAQTVRDETSITEFGEKHYELKLDIQSSQTGMDAANFMLGKYSQPIIRASKVVIYPSSSQSLWAGALASEIGTCIRVQNMPSTAPATQMDFYVESIDHTIYRDGSALIWTTSFDVSPTFNVAAWVLNDTARSVLDSSTKLTY